LKCGAGEGWRGSFGTDCLKNEVFTKSQGGKEFSTNSKNRKTGHILRRNCRLQHVIEGKIEERIEMTGRRGKRHKHLLDDL